jgi:hypothetical protein
MKETELQLLTDGNFGLISLSNDTSACHKILLNYTRILSMQQFVSVQGSISSEYPNTYWTRNNTSHTAYSWRSFSPCGFQRVAPPVGGETCPTCRKSSDGRLRAQRASLPNRQTLFLLIAYLNFYVVTAINTKSTFY